MKTLRSMILPSLFWAIQTSSLAAPSTPRKAALVSGANKGVGKEIIRLLINSAKESGESWILFLGSRDFERGNAALNDLKADLPKGITIEVCPLDLTDKNSIEAAKDQIEIQGNGKLDVLVNNAAICFNDSTLYGKVLHTPFEKQAGITIQTNFFGTLQVTQAMLPLLQKSSSPRIINIASSAGRLAILRSQKLVDTFTSPDLQLPKLENLMKEFVQQVEAGTHTANGWPNTCYGMSKLGIIAMTKVLARDYPDVMINSVDPGYCSTDQNNHQGILPPERGAVTPVILAMLPDENVLTGRYFFQEQEIEW